MKRFSQVELLQITKLTFKPLKNGWYRCIQTLEKVRRPKRYSMVLFRIIQGIRLSLWKTQKEGHEKIASSRLLHHSDHNRANMIANIAAAAAAGQYHVLQRERPEFRLAYLNDGSTYCPRCYRDVLGVTPGIVKCDGGHEFIAVARPQEADEEY